MKKIISGLLLSLSYCPLIWGGNISLKQNNVNWNNTSSWNINRMPQNGDTVTIPAGLTVVVNNNVYTNAPNLYLKVKGTISFQPNGKLDLGISSVVELLAGGTILSNSTGSERILIGGVIKYKGNNDGTIGGYALANSLSPASGSGAGSGFLTGTLEVTIKSFDAVKLNNKAYINWQTASEKDADYFELQRSQNQNNWETVYRIKAFNQNNGGSYNYVDTDPLLHDLYFRLKMVQKDGGITYSSISLVRQNETKSKISIYPNPTQDYAIVSFGDSFRSGSIQLSNFEGQVVYKKPITVTQGFVKIEMSTFPKGTYILDITDRGKKLGAEKIILR
ncbi:MAG: T9SS type A sorting domain-containing protein [Sphingobacteriales bacterium]|nr:T9SS type A sorting domain-containing protein [Sphingobacteriales bacterium]